MIPDKIIKTRHLSIENADLARIKSKIAQLNGIASVTIATNKLIVTYDLRQINYQQIKKYLSEIAAINTESMLIKLRSSFIYFCERNEIDHANSPTGWGYYIQNVYLSLHKENHY